MTKKEEIAALKKELESLKTQTSTLQKEIQIEYSETKGKKEEYQRQIQSEKETLKFLKERPVIAHIINIALDKIEANERQLTRHNDQFKTLEKYFEAIKKQYDTISNAITFGQGFQPFSLRRKKEI